MGLLGEYRHAHVTSDGLADYIASRRMDPQWRGCNVTMPHKQAVMPLLDALDPLAARVKAVNTIIRADDGTLTGYNTDVSGFLEPLKRNLAGAHLFRMARIIGTGGAARAIIVGLYDAGFTLVIAGRNEGKARALLDELAPNGEHYTAPLSHFSQPTDFAFDDRDGILDLVVNASALGMHGQDQLVFDMSHAPPGSVFYDIVTHPQRTLFLERAEDAGHPIIGGLAMLIGQARTAFALFFGANPPRESDAKLYALLSQASSS